VTLSDWLSNGSPYGLLIVCIITVVRGDWIPKKAHDTVLARVVEGKDALIVELRAQLAASDVREGALLDRLDKQASALERLDDNIDSIHLIIDGLIRTMREREGLPPAGPSSTVGRRRGQGGD
jgi:hypothetical protein